MMLSGVYFLQCFKYRIIDVTHTYMCVCVCVCVCVCACVRACACVCACMHGISMVGRSLVTTAWRILGLQMEEPVYTYGG
jgi:hypothetical protein